MAPGGNPRRGGGPAPTSHQGAAGLHRSSSETATRGFGHPKEQGTAVLAWRSPEIRESSGLRLPGWNDVLTSGSGFINPLASSKTLTAM